jgi:IS1 family transposase
MVNMNRLPMAKRVAVVSALVEGNSIRATVRMTGVAKNTVVKLLVDLGDACAAYQDRSLRNLNSKRVQADEIWSFIYAKKKHVTEEIAEKIPGAGDVWTWTAIDADSKLMISWMVGSRDSATAVPFMKDVASRLTNRVQLTTDAWKVYLTAVDKAFIGEVDYAQLHKLYAHEGGGGGRYSPPVCIGTKCLEVQGSPNPKHISTSYVERSNLSMRMHMRRFTRLTNAFSKKLENHAAAVAVYFMYYNFGRIHQTLRVTPAMEAGVTDHVWSVEEIVALAG